MVRTGLVATLLLLPLTAVAQPKPAKPAAPAAPAAPAKPAEGNAGSEVQLEDDPPAAPGRDGETGADENPDAPRLGNQPIETGPKPPRPRPTGYPVNEVLRPITLPDFTSETRLDVRVFPSDFDAEIGVRARYGITRQAQVGVRYAIGGFYDDMPTDASDKIKFNTGKTVGVEFQYLVQDWIAPRVSIPMYVDPFAIGMTLGAAMKFRIGDKLALVGFEDVIGFKLTDKFVPDLENERANETAARALSTGTINPDGYLRFDVGAVYQATPDLALTGRFGTTFGNFSDKDTGTSLRAQAQFTPTPKVDLIGQVGFERLDESSTLNIGGAIQVRI